ncbi:MAG: DNA topoisomerase [Filifactoraceae bacterium]
MKTLVIAEKPSLAKEIAKTLGIKTTNKGYFEDDNYIITFVFGHLMVLKDIDDYKNRGKTSWKLNELPFVPSKFEFKIRDDKGVKNQYEIIKKLILRNDVTLLINAGDADREGEVIVNNVIYSVLRGNGLEKNVKRLWLHTQNEDGITKAFESMKDILETRNLYSEGLARTYIDWLYGINLTRYITLKSGDLLPVGRVLIPIVKKVYDRYEEIKNFVPEKYYEVDAVIKKDGAELKSSLKDAKFSLEDKEKAEKLLESLQDRQFPVTKITKKLVEKSPKKLFSLTSLQNHMAKRYKIGLDETLKIAQGLYEKGLITYPRTNTEYLTNEEKNDVKKLIEKYKTLGYNLEFKDKKTIFDNSKVESHSALMITSVIPNIERLQPRERLLYETILFRFVSNFLAEKTTVEETKISIKVDGRVIELRGNVIVNEGFYKYEKPDQNEKILPHFEKGELVDVEFSLSEKETSKPKNLTLDELNTYLQNPFKKEIQEAKIKEKSEKNSEYKDVKSSEDADEEDGDDDDNLHYKQLLEGLEIGTVATRDSIIKNAERYNYITIKKTVLDITDKGIYLIETLGKLSIDLSKEKTVESSKILKAIYRNEMRVSDAVLKIQGDLRTIIGANIQIEKIKSSKLKFSTKADKVAIGICPRCGKRVFENSVSFYCEGFREEVPCKFSLWKDNKTLKDEGLVLDEDIVIRLLKDKDHIVELEKMTVELLDKSNYIDYKITRY